MGEDLKTIKELADELGISKQAIRKYFDKLPPTMVPTKEKGRYLLNADIQAFIEDKVSTVDRVVEPTVDSLVGTLKDRIIEDKDNQIQDLKEQNNDLRKLLDQQQQLQLKTQQMLEEKTQLLETTKKKKWYHFWK